jgi:hypothetical protein
MLSQYYHAEEGVLLASERPNFPVADHPPANYSSSNTLKRCYRYYQTLDVIRLEPQAHIIARPYWQTVSVVDIHHSKLISFCHHVAS